MVGRALNGREKREERSKRFHGDKGEEERRKSGFLSPYIYISIILCKYAQTVVCGVWKLINEQ